MLLCSLLVSAAHSLGMRCGKLSLAVSNLYQQPALESDPLQKRLYLVLILSPPSTRIELCAARSGVFQGPTDLAHPDEACDEALP